MSWYRALSNFNYLTYKDLMLLDNYQKLNKNGKCDLAIQYFAHHLHITAYNYYFDGNFWNIKCPYMNGQIWTRCVVVIEIGLNKMYFNSNLFISRSTITSSNIVQPRPIINQTMTICIHEKNIWNVICKMSAIMFKPQCGNGCQPHAVE